MDGISIKVDTSEFDRTFREYMKYTSRDLTESVNQHAYYIARDAVNVTKAVDKDKIAAELSGPSHDYPEAPLAAILVQKQRAAQGLRGLNGEKMARAVEKLIRKRQSYRNFLRAGWIPAVKLLASVVPRKGGASLKGVKMKGAPKGGAKAAVQNMFNWSPMASIWNSIQKGADKVEAILQQGAAEAIEMETESMKTYIEGKQLQRSKQFWNS